MKQKSCAKNISYIISVSVGTGCYRHLRISGNETLHDLADAILWAFDFKHDHLYSFFMDNIWWSPDAEYRSPFDGEPPSADRVKLAKLRLEKGQAFKFVFDYGDEWRFQCKVLQILNERTDDTEIVRMKGAPPEQYPYYEESEEEYPAAVNAVKPDSSTIAHTVNPVIPPADAVTAGIEDEVLEAAFQYRSDQLWKKLNDTEFFAVQLSGGEIGYCSVMGILGECVTIALYIGDEGLWSLQKTMENHFEYSFDCMLLQNCLQMELTDKDDVPEPVLNDVAAYAGAHGISLKGKKRYPAFLKFQSYLVPDRIRSQEDFRYLTEALRAAHEVAVKLKSVPKAKLGLDDTLHVIPLLTPDGNGFRWSLMKKPDTVSYPYAKPAVPKDTAEALRALSQKGTWECRMYILSEPTTDEKAERSFFLPLLLTAGGTKKLRREISGSGYYPDVAGDMLGQLAAWMREVGVRPKEIVTHGARSLAFLEQLCEVCGILLTEADHLPLTEKMLTEHYRRYEEAYFGQLSQITDMLMMLEQMEESELRILPKDMLAALAEQIGTGLMSHALEERIASLV